MSHNDDPLNEALANLRPIATDAAWESRVQARCQSVLRKRAALRQRPRGSSAAMRVALISGAAALCAYLAAAFAEALRLAGHY